MLQRGWLPLFLAPACWLGNTAPEVPHGKSRPELADLTHAQRFAGSLRVLGQTAFDKPDSFPIADGRTLRVGPPQRTYFASETAHPRPIFSAAPPVLAQVTPNSGEHDSAKLQLRAVGITPSFFLSHYLSRLGISSIYGVPPWDMRHDQSQGSDRPTLLVDAECARALRLVHAPFFAWLPRALPQRIYGHAPKKRLVGANPIELIYNSEGIKSAAQCGEGLKQSYLSAADESARLTALIRWSRSPPFVRRSPDEGSGEDAGVCWKARPSLASLSGELTTPDPLLSVALLRLRCMIGKGRAPFELMDTRPINLTDLKRGCAYAATVEAVPVGTPTAGELCPPQQRKVTYVRTTGF